MNVMMLPTIVPYREYPRAYILRGLALSYTKKYVNYLQDVSKPLQAAQLDSH